MAFLRGVNLGPTRRLNMSELREAVGMAGHPEVRTYLQSGNLVLAADDRPAEVAKRIRDVIQESFGLQTAVVVRNEGELRSVIDANPFPGAAADDPTKVHVTFLEPMPPAAAWETVEKDSFRPDEFQVGEGVVYLHLPDGMARTKLPGALERATADSASTTRNWRTVTKLAEMLEG